MVNIKNTLSCFKQNARNKVQKGIQKFKENFSKAKSKPRYKQKSLVLGITSIFGIFGQTLHDI